MSKTMDEVIDRKIKNMTAKLNEKNPEVTLSESEVRKLSLLAFNTLREMEKEPEKASSHLMYFIALAYVSGREGWGK